MWLFALFPLMKIKSKRMFSTPTYTINKVKKESFSQIAEVYNSNPEFLRHHIGLEQIDVDWVSNEWDEMEKVGFACCKIVENQMGNVAGLIDFKLSEQTYLSAHGSWKHQAP